MVTMAFHRTLVVLFIWTLLGWKSTTTPAAEPPQQPPPVPVSTQRFLESPDDWEGWILPDKAPALPLKDGGAEIRGTKDRNNPLRRQLAKALSDPVLYLSFEITYREGMDSVPDGDGEFLVFWLDDRDGGAGNTHADDVPNFGIHVATGGAMANKNVFMVRQGSRDTAFSKQEVQEGRTYQLVGRLAKSSPSSRSPYDLLDLWIQPTKGSQAQPLASLIQPSRLTAIRWIGFSTGRKTEAQDRIEVKSLQLGTSWASVTGLEEPNLPIQLEDSSLAANPGSQPAPPPPVDFQKDIHPILSRHCWGCHGSDPDPKAPSLITFSAMRSAALGSVRGPSLLDRLASQDPQLQMPPPTAKSQPTPEERRLLERWVQEGLAWDDLLLPDATPPSEHWAFQPLTRPRIPSISSPRTSASGLNVLLHAAWAENGIEPPPRAKPETLARRLALDLVGLPPDPSRTREYLNQPSASTWRQLIDHYLADPGYGERWGRHWLDLARFAESNGHQHNRERPHAWRYRDYVIQSFNQDKPYDLFLREQIAGDELSPLSEEAVVATGFLAAARYSGNELDKAIQRHDIFSDMVNNVGATVLGLTFECAQCHDHKTDPLTTRDWYRFQAFFAKGQPVNVVLPTGEKVREEALDWVQERREIFDAVWSRLVFAERRRRPKGEILIQPSTVEARMAGAEKDRYQELGRKLQQFPMAWSYYSPVTSPHHLPVPRLALRWPLPWDPEEMARSQTHVLDRGDVTSPTWAVYPGWPSFLPSRPSSKNRKPAPSRTDLVDWLVSRENPLTARVWANRVWQHHFGKGLVETPGDFGVQTPEPTLRAVLDWLACELVDSGWSTKHLHRLILESDAWCATFHVSERNQARDPDNQLFWNREPHRLEFEVLHDSLLALAGGLEREGAGPSEKQPFSMAANRRAIYHFVKRNEPNDMARVFDGPDPLSACHRRNVSTVPLQPLFLLNHEWVLQQADRIAERILESSPSGHEKLADRAFQYILGRAPTQEESSVLQSLLEQEDSQQPRVALASLCTVLLNLNEMIYSP